MAIKKFNQNQEPEKAPTPKSLFDPFDKPSEGVLGEQVYGNGHDPEEAFQEARRAFEDVIKGMEAQLPGFQELTGLYYQMMRAPSMPVLKAFRMKLTELATQEQVDVESLLSLAISLIVTLQTNDH